MTLDATTGATAYEIYGYQPQFDPISNLWFVDVHLDTSHLHSPLPPGYFLQLALVRFQPYSTGLEYNWTSPLTLLTYAQPVTDRYVLVQEGPNRTLAVEVLGAGYHGWRSVATHSVPSTSDLTDKDNPTATHPNSDGGGTRSTSTMVVEVQEYTAGDGFSGDFGWTTLSGYTVALTPKFTDTSFTGWDSDSTSASGGIKLPVTTRALRLCISELDYFGPPGTAPPPSVDTTLRRTFVVHIPVSSGRRITISP
ncbi:MAG: hypothetical protein ACRD0Z_05865 [Acidimicrobiales bacterium]